MRAGEGGGDLFVGQSAAGREQEPLEVREQLGVAVGRPTWLGLGLGLGLGLVG